MKNNKCNCGLNAHVFCKKCSKIKIAIMLKNGQKHLKIYNPSNNRNENPVWYSPVKYNHQNIELILNKMLQALQKQTQYSGAVNCLMVYNNHNKSFYKKIQL